MHVDVGFVHVCWCDYKRLILFGFFQNYHFVVALANPAESFSWSVTGHTMENSLSWHTTTMTRSDFMKHMSASIPQCFSKRLRKTPTISTLTPTPVPAESMLLWLILRLISSHPPFAFPSYMVERFMSRRIPAPVFYVPSRTEAKCLGVALARSREQDDPPLASNSHAWKREAP